MANEKFFKTEMTEEELKDNVSLFAQRLKELRLKRKVSQEKISKVLGLGICTYGTYEKDKYIPDAVTVRNMAKFFGVSADYLLRLSDESEPPAADNSILSDFINKYGEDLWNILYDVKTEFIFKNMIYDKEFVRLLYYMDVYLTYSAKFSKEETKRLRESEVYNDAYKIDVSQKLDNVMALPDGGIEIANLYLHLIHDKVDEILRTLARENEMEFKYKMNKILRDVASDKEYNWSE